MKTSKDSDSVANSSRDPGSVIVSSISPKATDPLPHSSRGPPSKIFRTPKATSHSYLSRLFPCMFKLEVCEIDLPPLTLSHALPASPVKVSSPCLLFGTKSVAQLVLTSRRVLPPLSPHAYSPAYPYTETTTSYEESDTEAEKALASEVVERWGSAWPEEGPGGKSRVMPTSFFLKNYSAYKPPSPESPE